MFTVWVVFHVIVCVALVLVVLMQSAKGEGLAGSAFGGGGGMSGAVFGGRGAASFLSRATTVLAIVFMLNCGALAFMSSSNRPDFTGAGSEAPPESVVTREAQREREQALQMQQERMQQQAADSAGATDLGLDIKEINVTPNEAAGTEETPAQQVDTSGN